jgi:hypothetical protein
MRLFRGMKEEADGFPAVGPSGRMLGVRPRSHPTPDVLANDPNDSVLPGGGGMSVAPNDPVHLHRHRRPSSLGGTGPDPVWYIDEEDLDPELRFRQDKATHGVIEPAQPMTLAELQNALARTRALWKLYCR